MKYYFQRHAGPVAQLNFKIPCQRTAEAIHSEDIVSNNQIKLPFSVLYSAQDVMLDRHWTPPAFFKVHFRADFKADWLLFLTFSLRDMVTPN